MTSESDSAKVAPGLAVIFDMDGVLVDSAEPHFRSWQILAEENGAAVTREQFGATFGRQNRDIIPLLFGPASSERMNLLADRKEAIYRDLIRAWPPVAPGAVALIDGLARESIPMAVGSSGPQANIELVLDSMGVRERISVVVSGDDVSRGKPDPQVFTLCCRRLEIAPERCVVIEDAPVGIAAARAAGTQCVAVLMHHPRESFGQADLVVNRLSELNVAALRELVTTPG